MTCPKCHSELPDSGFDNTDGFCPECGVRLLRNVSGVMKTSAVMIAARGERGFYRSVQDVPEPLRSQLLETTTSQNSGVIVIADRAGKEQLTQVMARREAGREGTRQTQSRLREAAPPGAPDSPAPLPIARLRWLPWAGFVLVLVLAAIVFAIFHTDWATFHIIGRIGH
jgi:hypothetical protein